MMKHANRALALLLFMLWALGAGAVETTRTLDREDVKDQYAGPSSQFVELDGVKVHYRDEGAGPAVLLVHGTLGDLKDWDGWMPAMTSRYRVIRLDLPGFGLSGVMENGNYSVDRMHTLIDSLMDHLKEETFSIVGISYGGMVVFRYAATRTDRVNAMVLLNSAGIESGRPIQRDDAQEKAAPPRNDIFTGPVVTTADIVEFYSAYINDHSKLVDTLIQRKVDYLNIAGRDEEGRIIRGLYERGNPQRVLAHVRAPSLVLWGSENQALQTKTAEAFVAALKSACKVKLEVYEKGGHYINIERPAQTVASTLEFLSEALEAEACSKIPSRTR